MSILAISASRSVLKSQKTKTSNRINRRPGKPPRVSDNAIDRERYIENRKPSVRCKVEHAFRIIKCQFGYKKTVYRGKKRTDCTPCSLV